MGYKATANGSSRLAASVAVTLLHALVIVLLIITLGVRETELSQPEVLTTVAIAIEPDRSAKAAPPPTLPSKMNDPTLTAPIFANGADSGEQTAAAGGCATLEMLGRALNADAAAVASVLHAPPETRSVAEAVVLWNAGWSEAAVSPDAPLEPARAVVEQSLFSLEDRCLDEAIAGPRLIPIPIADETMFVVIGSGNWTWREMVRDPADSPGSGSGLSALLSDFLGSDEQETLGQPSR